MPSFSIPLSGLSASSSALSAIANNIANLNTVAYKGMRPEFRDLFYQQIGTTGSGNPISVGAGAAVGNMGSIFTQGSIENTGVATDLAIQGNGFFVTDKGGFRSYTRAGNFSLSSDGYLVTADGSRVLGFPSVSGRIDSNQPPTAIQIANGQISPPNATTQMQLQMNLDAQAADGTTFNTSCVVYDSLGSSHIVSVQFTKSAANQWDFDMTIPGADVTPTSTNPVSVQKGTITFDASGAISNISTSGGSGAAGTNAVTGIQIAGLADGANDITFNWNMAQNGNNIVTQLAGPSTTSATSQNGYSSGTLMSFSISSDGSVLGTFNNGQTRALGQIAIATFANEDGLDRQGQNSYLPTLASGAADIGVAGTGGRGSIAGGALELSNVDIATEFSRLILAQRGFQANARTVTTFDEITQEAINLKR